MPGPAAILPKVSASLFKTAYKVGEPIDVTATLENAGTESFYVPKQIGESSGSIPGFDIVLLHNGKPFCHTIRDYACSATRQKRSSTEQLLNEHFLLLPPGGLIGIHIHLATSCWLPHSDPAPPGTYEVQVAYYGSDVCVPDLSNRRAQFLVLQSTVNGEPIHLELTQ